MFETTSDSIRAAISDPSNYDEQTIASVILLDVSTPNIEDLDSATYTYLLEWA